MCAHACSLHVQWAQCLNGNGDGNTAAYFVFFLHFFPKNCPTRHSHCISFLFSTAQYKVQLRFSV